MSIEGQRGITLVELIVAMVIIAAAVAGVVGAFSITSRASADPVITKQMAAIAEGMMEEILLKPYSADGPTTGRDAYNEVSDFNGYTTTNGITNVKGDAVAGLENYNVTVTVQQANPSLTDIPATDALRITVVVSHPNGTFRLTGWRTRP